MNVVRKIIVYFVQLFVISLIKLVGLPFVRRRNLAAARNLSGALIVANHRRAFDPFIICAALPYRYAFALMPFAFITANSLYFSWRRLGMWLMGCYPARQQEGSRALHGIEASTDFLRQGYSIVIFPEGKRIRPPERGMPYPGVVTMHQAVPSAGILTCHIEYTGSGRSTHITFGRFDRPLHTADEIMDEIYTL